MSSQLITAHFRLPQGYAFHTAVLHHRVSNQIYEMRCFYEAVGLSASFVVLPSWDNMP